MLNVSKLGLWRTFKEEFEHISVQVNISSTLKIILILKESTEEPGLSISAHSGMRSTSKEEIELVLRLHSFWNV